MDNTLTDLDIARSLIALGTPLFLADLGPKGEIVRRPKKWQKTEPDLAVVKRWRPDKALCAVTGVIFDVLDVDPRNGGNESLAEFWDELNEPDGFPPVWGVAGTASGGWPSTYHHLDSAHIPAFVPA